MCGKLINLTLENLAKWLELQNYGTEIFVLKKWPSQPPAVGSEMNYHEWFYPNQPLDPIYSTSLPSLHRFAHLLINNLLIPKAKIKTNIEFSGLFYLRHLLSLDNLDPHISYIILCHMNTAAKNSQHSLPYAHIIHKILASNGIELPADFQRIAPVNLCNELPSVGWVRKEINGIGRHVPNDRPINQ